MSLLQMSLSQLLNPRCPCCGCVPVLVADHPCPCCRCPHLSCWHPMSLLHMSLSLLHNMSLFQLITSDVSVTDVPVSVAEPSISLLRASLSHLLTPIPEAGAPVLVADTPCSYCRCPCPSCWPPMCRPSGPLTSTGYTRRYEQYSTAQYSCTVLIKGRFNAF